MKSLGNWSNLVNFIVIFINKNTYIIPTNAYVTYRSVKDTDNVSRHVFSTKSTRKPQGAPAGGYLHCKLPFLKF